MAGNQPDGLGVGDDFFEQILAVPPPYGGGGGGSEAVSVGSMALQVGSGGRDGESGGGYRAMGMGLFPLGLNLEHGFLKQGDGIAVDSNTNKSNNDDASCSANTAVSGISERDSMQMSNLFRSLGQIQAVGLSLPPPPSQPHLHQFHSQPASAVTVSQPPAIRPRVRARRGQATDPHSIAERLRRERIAERMKALQELVPSCNKTDRAAMLDEIVDYVKFLRLQVKVLSMSRLGAAGAVAQLVSDVPPSSTEGDGVEGRRSQAVWEKWASDGTEAQVAKLMEEDVGAAMQFLQPKALCIMPLSLASAIFRTHLPDGPMMVRPETNGHP